MSKLTNVSHLLVTNVILKQNLKKIKEKGLKGFTKCDHIIYFHGMVPGYF